MFSKLQARLSPDEWLHGKKTGTKVSAGKIIPLHDYPAGVREPQLRIFCSFRSLRVLREPQWRLRERKQRQPRVRPWQTSEAGDLHRCQRAAVADRSNALAVEFHHYVIIPAVAGRPGERLVGQGRRGRPVTVWTPAASMKDICRIMIYRIRHTSIIR